MSQCDHIFINMCRDILENGTDTRGEKVRPHWPDGTPAYTIKQLGICNRYDLRKEFPALTLRRTALKSAMDESKVLTLVDSDLDAKVPFRLWSNKNSDSQKFEIKYCKNGMYTISPLSSKKYIGVNFMDYNPGAPIRHCLSEDGNTKKWYIVPAEDGSYSIYSRYNDYFIDIKDEEIANGTFIHGWFYNESEAQNFKITPVK